MCSSDLVKKDSRVTKKTVQHLGIPKGFAIGGLVRNGEGILVNGDTQIKEGDHVVVFCLNTMIKKIEKLFN